MLEHIWDRRNPAGEAPEAGSAGDRKSAVPQTRAAGAAATGRQPTADAAGGRPPARASEPPAAATRHPQAMATRASGEATGGETTEGPAGREDQRLVVGARIHLKGEVSNCDALIVQGHLEGSAKSRAVQVAHGGTFVGDAEVEIAEVSGSFQGTLTTSGNLIIRSTGRVQGTIRYYGIQIEPGGQIGGDVQVTEDAGAARPARPAVAANAPEAAVRTGP